MDILNSAKKVMRWALYAPGRGFFRELGVVKTHDEYGEAYRLAARTVNDHSRAFTWNTHAKMVRDIESTLTMIGVTSAMDFGTVKDPFADFVEVKVPVYEADMSAYGLPEPPAEVPVY